MPFIKIRCFYSWIKCSIYCMFLIQTFHFVGKYRSFLEKKCQNFSHFMYLFWLENSKPCDKSIGVYTPNQPKPKPNHWLILLGVLSSISGLTWKCSRTQWKWKWKWHASWCSWSVSLSTGVTIKTRNVMSRDQDKSSVNAKKDAQSGLSISQTEICQSNELEPKFGGQSH